MAYGILLLRIAVGTTMAGHGVQKLLGWFDGPARRARSRCSASSAFRLPPSWRRWPPRGDRRPALRRRPAHAAGRPRHRDRDAERDRHRPLEERLLELRGRLRVPAGDARGRGRGRSDRAGRFSADRLIGWDGSLSGLWWGLGSATARVRSHASDAPNSRLARTRPRRETPMRRLPRSRARPRSCVKRRRHERKGLRGTEVPP